MRKAQKWGSVLALILLGTQSASALDCASAAGFVFQEQDGNVVTFATQTFSITLKAGETAQLTITPLGVPFDASVQVDGNPFPSGATLANTGAADRTYSIVVFVHEASFSVNTNCTAAALSNPAAALPNPATHSRIADLDKASEEVADAFVKILSNYNAWSNRNEQTADAESLQRTGRRLNGPARPAPLSIDAEDTDTGIDANGDLILNEGESIAYSPKGHVSESYFSFEHVLAYGTEGKPSREFNPANANWAITARAAGAYAAANHDDRKATGIGLGVEFARRFTDSTAGSVTMLTGYTDASSTASGSDLNTTYLGASANLSYRIRQNLFFIGYGYYIHGENEGSVGTTAFDYSTHTYGFGGKIETVFNAGGWYVKPSGSANWKGKTRDTSFDSTGTLFPGETSNRLAADAAIAFQRPFQADFGAFDKGYLEFGGNTRIAGAASGFANDGLTGGLRTGVTLLSGQGAVLSLVGTVDGLGGDITIWGGQARLRIPFGNQQF
jgi:hypothetical protein